MIFRTNKQALFMSPEQMNGFQVKKAKHNVSLHFDSQNLTPNSYFSISAIRMGVKKIPAKQIEELNDKEVTVLLFKENVITLQQVCDTTLKVYKCSAGNIDSRLLVELNKVLVMDDLLFYDEHQGFCCDKVLDIKHVIPKEIKMSKHFIFSKNKGVAINNLLVF